MAKIGVIGGGAFGTAMACVARRSGNDVVLWAREPDVVAAINADRMNHHFLDLVRMPEGIVATGELAEAVRGRDVILSAVPSQFLRGVARQMAAFLAPGTPVVNLSKGVERGTCALMPEVLAEALPGARLAVLSGPSLAREIALELPCGVTLACADGPTAERLGQCIGNERFRPYLSTDVTGAAIGGVMKNVVSIASGLFAGRKLGENARATLITRGVAEAARLGLAKGARAETFLGLCGMGDMMLTANSLQSRNTSLGVALGEGHKLADILASRKSVSEGAASAQAVAELAVRLGVDLPITRAVDALLNHGAGVEATVSALLHDPYHYDRIKD